ncbi:DNA topoisomerase 2-like protein [Tanacetum coccineum]
MLTAFVMNLVQVTELSVITGRVREHTTYKHGDTSLTNTIMGMAKNYVGSNNINLLQPDAQFGTRQKGGKDRGQGRYLKTRLSPITPYLFHKDDDILFKNPRDAGLTAAPKW